MIISDLLAIGLTISDLLAIEFIITLFAQLAMYQIIASLVRKMTALRLIILKKSEQLTGNVVTGNVVSYLNPASDRNSD